MTFSTAGFELHEWQRAAVDAWVSGVDGRPYRGTLEVVTGGGKTLIALACAEKAAGVNPDLRLAVVVPTEALARQWRKSLINYTTLEARDVGLLGAGKRDTFTTHRALVAIINTAAPELPDLAEGGQPLMLIVDECHRAGAPKHSRVLRTKADYRLGLSATPDREELDEDGEPLTYDEQAVGLSLGGVVYRFTLKDARRVGWLPEFTLHHHGIALSEDERRKYDAVSRQVDDAADELRGHGVDSGRARSMAGRGDEVGEAARRWVHLTAQRKDLLYRAQERHRVVGLVMRSLFGRPGGEPRVILFHERVNQAIELFETLKTSLPGIRVELEHSKLPDRRREQALDAFASGAAPVLVSVKSLVEGIDVPEADTGVSVASTSAVRQRVQSLGRVLRRSVTSAGEAKQSTMHLLYVAETVDEMIYAKADWTDLTGSDSNRYWRWEYKAEAPIEVDSPPRTPLPTEDQAWTILGERVPQEPVPWPGMPWGREYSVKTNGAVHNEFGAQIANPQGVAEMVATVRGREGGRFRVTPEYSLVLVWDAEAVQGRFLVAGRLSEPFRVLDEVQPDATGVDLSALSPGDDLPGNADKKGGTFKITQRSGGLIERRVNGGSEIAQTADAGQPQLEGNARSVLAAWEQLDRAFSRFFVTSSGDAWFEGPESRKFIARVKGGFAWPR